MPCVESPKGEPVRKAVPSYFHTVGSPRRDPNLEPLLEDVAGEITDSRPSRAVTLASVLHWVQHAAVARRRVCSGRRRQQQPGRAGQPEQVLPARPLPAGPAGADQPRAARQPGVHADGRLPGQQQCGPCRVRALLPPPVRRGARARAQAHRLRQPARGNSLHREPADAHHRDVDERAGRAAEGAGPRARRHQPAVRAAPAGRRPLPRPPDGRLSGAGVSGGTDALDRPATAAHHAAAEHGHRPGRVLAGPRAAALPVTRRACKVPEIN